MKIIHCADLHLDSKMETHLAPGKAQERKREILHTFERMVDYAVKNQVQAIIIAGDMFDTARITNFTQTRVLNTIKKFPQVDFLYLSGNHDESNFIQRLENIPANLKIFGNQWTIFNYPDCNIAGVVLGENNHATIYDTLNLPPDDVNLVVLHGQTSQYNTPDKGELINLNQLKNKNIDYLALGHIHSYTQAPLDKRGIYCYAGCLEGRGFDECGEKGFVLLEINQHQLRTQFVPFAERQLKQIVFNLTDYEDWFAIEDKILSQVENENPANMLKITLCGNYQMQMDKQISMLEKKLARFYCVKIKDESVLKVTKDDVANDISLRGEFIRQVLSSKLSPKEQEQTILIGLRALAGEDL